MQTLEKMFSQSYLSDDGTSPLLPHEIQELSTAALASWTLLASTLPTNLTHELIRMSVAFRFPSEHDHSNEIHLGIYQRKFPVSSNRTMVSYGIKPVKPSLFSMKSHEISIVYVPRM